MKKRLELANPEAGKPKARRGKHTPISRCRFVSFSGDRGNSMSPPHCALRHQLQKPRTSVPGRRSRRQKEQLIR